MAIAGGTGTAGRQAVAAAEAEGHQVVVLSRARGVDVRTGAGLAAALKGVEVIVDATNAGTTKGDEATAFFTEVADRLQGAGAAAGVRRLVVLSIVGIDRVPGYPYYQAKLAHEWAALAGPLQVSIVRATQFHEFPGQLMSWTRKGPVALVPHMQVQTVAARAVGQVLAEVAAEPEGPAMLEVAGPPPPADLVDRARALVAQRGERTLVVPLRRPGAAARAMRTGAQLPGAGARLVGPSFDEWLTGPDAGEPAGVAPGSPGAA